MQDFRGDPDEILQKIKKEESKRGYGHLKIFFGYAAGVGKTYAMLEAAHEAKKQKIDVVAGYVEPHARPETAQLLEGLEQLPTKKIKHNNITLEELDLDAAIKRKPQLILVDELAHTNAPGSRHLKRYQDINELLKNGINVYTTVNVQHIESLNDLVASITGVTVKERILDSVFDDADQVELVDIEPQELIERLNDGKVYHKKQAGQALDNFFTEKNLLALREIALRRCADRVNKISEQSGDKTNSSFTDEHILVCLSSALSNEKIIRAAARMAGALKGYLTALFVETPDFANMSTENKKRLHQNMRLAEQLGATIETVYGDDIAFQIAEFARLSGISKIILGRSSARRNLFFGGPPLTEKITHLAPNLDIYIIPDQYSSNYKLKKSLAKKEKFQFIDLVKSLLILLASTIIGFLFFKMGFRDANIIAVYILGVLVTAVVTSRQIYSLISSIISVLLFNFLFTRPHFNFSAYGDGYPATFIIMFIAAFLTSSLAIRIKNQARRSAATAYRTKILFDTSQLINNENDYDGIIAVTCKQLRKLLNKDIVFYGIKDDILGEPDLFMVNKEQDPQKYVSEHEKAVASWVLKNNKHAGATTNTLGDSECLYLSVRVNQDIYGVIGIAINENPLEALENSIMLSILGQCALALKNQKITSEREEATLFAKNEQLRANLLRSISHDLRTPLTAISGNAGILLASEKNIDKAKRIELYNSIYDDSLWLINLFENLLSVTRIEDGTMQLNCTTELLDEIISEAIRHTDHKCREHNLILDFADDFILVKVDTRLIMQVIINLVDNACKYTPKHSDIIIKTQKSPAGTEAIITVSDNGEGISDDAKKHIFDMFYTANISVPDGKRSLGLGLALCKSIINAHEGEIFVLDNIPQGTIFKFTLPIKEVILHE